MYKQGQPPPYGLQQPSGGHPVQSAPYGLQPPPGGYPDQSPSYGYQPPPGGHPVQSPSYGYQPPPGGYPMQPLPGGYPVQTQQSGTIVVQQSVGGASVIGMSAVGPRSQQMTCSACRQNIRTKVRNKANSRTHCWASCICCFLIWPLIFIPYCTNCCQDSYHYCPNCDAFLGAYKR